MTKINREEQTEIGEKEINDVSVLMKLKIQRLGKDDFFISTSRKGLITHLKEKILTFVKAERSETDDLQLSVRDMRLIYKGMVLVDSKSVEFYKIENDDTIQLCPYNRKKRAQASANRAGDPANNSGAEAQNEAAGHQQLIGGPGEFTFISFSLTEQPINGRIRNRSAQNTATRNQETQTSTDLESSNESSSTITTSIRRHLILPVINNHTPTTMTDNLCNFKSVLQETIHRLSATNLENIHELVTQLDVLIRRATTLRGGLSTAEEKDDVPATESHTNLNPPLVRSHTGSINIHPQGSIPSVLRYLPLRLNLGTASENTVESSVDPVGLESGQVADALGDSGSGQAARSSGNRAEQPRIVIQNQVGHRAEHRNNHSRSIFHILNRFERC